MTSRKRVLAAVAFAALTMAALAVRFSGRKSVPFDGQQRPAASAAGVQAKTVPPQSSGAQQDTLLARAGKTTFSPELLERLKREGRLPEYLRDFDDDDKATNE